MPVLVTETAAREIASIIQQQGLDPEAIRLRVGVKGGGCSGFSYLLDLTESAKDSDEVWEYPFEFAEASDDGDGPTVSNLALGNIAPKIQGEFMLKVICDPKSCLYLNGTQIDFKDEVMGRGFVFNNPNATSTCGCGSSFAV